MATSLDSCNSEIGSISQGTSTSTVSAEYAGALKIKRIAAVNILKGDALKCDSSTHVSLADGSLTKEDATVVGFADADTPAGAEVLITIMGAITDPIFAGFSVNAPLFLDETGGITDTKRTTGFHTIVGSALGSNQIFVRIAAPIQLS